jgi:hypothetical protein
MMRPFVGLFWFLLLAALVVGCTPKVKTVPVSGRITLDQKPLVGATVTFSPVDAPDKAPLEGGGKTDDQGTFSLKLTTDNTKVGVPPGNYKVRIALFDREAGPRGVQRVPEKYNSQTVLTFTVPAEGTTSANFDLNSQL